VEKVAFRILYEQEVVKHDIPCLSKTDGERVRSAIGDKLVTAPEFFGKPLRRSLRGYRALRVGDFRVVFRIQEKTVKIFLIAHRSVVYERYQERFS